VATGCKDPGAARGLQCVSGGGEGHVIEDDFTSIADNRKYDFSPMRLRAATDGKRIGEIARCF
jgi:hypothetical protein